MSSSPEFFVPGTDSETAEAVYAEHARMCGRSIAPPGKRIFSIVFTSNNEEWTATVGEPLTGVFRRVTQVGAKKLELVQKLDDPAIVLSIFSGDPYRVLTNDLPHAPVRSTWDNPFMATPTAVTYFASKL
jgi:hypothetical protein